MASNNEQAFALADRVRGKYVDMLMSKANVMGVGIGRAKVGFDQTDEVAIIVMVDRKVPLDQLEDEDIIPRELEGVRIDVQETGYVDAQSTV